MQEVTTQLDGFILAIGGVAVLLLAGVLIGISKIISYNKKVLENQQNQSKLLMEISNVLTTNEGASGLQNKQEAGLAEKSLKQD